MPALPDCGGQVHPGLCNPFHCANAGVGRTEYDSPEVDPEVLIPVEGAVLRKGCFYNVEIVDSDDFDLYGRKVD